MTHMSFLGFAEPIASLTHLIGALVFLILGFQLVYHSRGNGLRIAAIIIYWFTIVYLLSMSGTYHILHEGLARHVLQRLDHAGIWLLIMGSYTPIHSILFTGWKRWGLLALIWAVGTTGLVLEVVFFRDFPEYLSLSLYLLLGWFGVVSSWLYVRDHKADSLGWMVGGGVAYSVGAIFDYLRWPVLLSGIFDAHDLFHLFVLLGISCHWVFIHNIANLGVTKKLTFLIKRRRGEPSFATAKSENIRFHFHDEADLEHKISQAVKETYRDYRCPQVIRLQYIEETFFDPIQLQTGSGEVFHNKKSG